MAPVTVHRQGNSMRNYPFLLNARSHYPAWVGPTGHYDLSP